MSEKEYADKTGVERSIERWEGEGGEVLPTALRIIERAAIEKQENKDNEEQHIGEEKVIEKIVQKTSRTTITKYLSQLTSLGVLTSKEVGNQVFYINQDLIRILEG